MQTAIHYDVFVVLSHVDGNVLHEFTPAWLQVELAKQPRDLVSGSPDLFHALVRSVQDWIVATRGSEFRKCPPGDTDVCKRIVAQVRRNALIAPPKTPKNTVYKLRFDVESPLHFGLIIGKHGRNIKMMQQRYGFFRVDIAELRVTIQACCLQALVRIRSSMQTRIQTHLQKTVELIHEKEVLSLEFLYIDIVEQKEQSKKRRAGQIINKKMMDCRKKTHVKNFIFRKRAKGKLQKLTL